MQVSLLVPSVVPRDLVGNPQGSPEFPTNPGGFHTEHCGLPAEFQEWLGVPLRNLNGHWRDLGVLKESRCFLTSTVPFKLPEGFLRIPEKSIVNSKGVLEVS